MQGFVIKVNRSFDICFTSGEVRHLHHDHAHVLGQHDDVVAGVVPLRNLQVELSLLNSEHFHLRKIIGLFNI